MIIETLLFSQYIHRNRCHHDNVRHRPVTYKDLVLMNSVERLVRRSMCELLSVNRNLDEPNMISSRNVGLSRFEYLFMNIERGLVCTVVEAWWARRLHRPIDRIIPQSTPRSLSTAIWSTSACFLLWYHLLDIIGDTYLYYFILGTSKNWINRGNHCV